MAVRSGRAWAWTRVPEARQGTLMARQNEWWVSAGTPDDSVRAHARDGCSREFLNLFVVANPYSNMLPCLRCQRCSRTTAAHGRF